MNLSKSLEEFGKVYCIGSVVVNSNQRTRFTKKKPGGQPLPDFLETPTEGIGFTICLAILSSTARPILVKVRIKPSITGRLRDFLGLTSFVLAETQPTISPLT